MKTRENIPEWALCYCINGDATELNDEEIAMIGKWMQDWHVEIISPLADDEGNYQAFFTHYPLFGLATTAVECEIIYHNPNPSTPPVTMTRMTINGVSTTDKGEQYEIFYSTHRGKRINRIMYDYRDTDNELFSCVAPTLAECRRKRDEWLKAKNEANK